MKKTFSFREEEQAKIMQLYQKVVEDMNTALDRCINQLQENSAKTRFQGVLQATNEIITFYNDEVSRIVMTGYNQWQESMGCLLGFAKTMHAGEEAENTARKLQRNVQNSLEMLLNKKYDPISISTADPAMDEEAYTRLGDSAKKLVVRLEEIKATALKQIQNRGESNQLFLCIESVVRITVEAVIGGFATFSESTRKLTEGMLEDERQVRSNIDEAAKDLSRAGNEAEELFRNFGSGFRMR